MAFDGDVWGMAKTPKKIDEADERSPADVERVADATLKRLLSTPPKPHKEMVGKGKKPSSVSGKMDRNE